MENDQMQYVVMSDTDRAMVKPKNVSSQKERIISSV